MENLVGIGIVIVIAGFVVYKIFWSKDKKNWDLSRIKNIFYNKNVYITFDVDSFDASIMPA